MVMKGYGPTSLPPVNSPLYEDITREIQQPLAGENADWWAYLVEQGLQEFQVGAGVGSPGPSDGDVLASIPIQTNPRTALAIYGGEIDFAWLAAADADDSFQPAMVLSYYQPSPPAANTTTPASVTGNLGLRNEMMNISMVVNRRFTTNGDFLTMSPHKIQRFFKRPPLIVGSALILQAFISTVAPATYNPANWSVHAGCRILAKYVDITSEQYVNLVALATGQAILPPSILG